MKKIMVPASLKTAEAFMDWYRGLSGEDQATVLSEFQRFTQEADRLAQDTVLSRIEEGKQGGSATHRYSVQSRE